MVNEWQAVANSADFISADGTFYATYKNTMYGLANYHVHPVSLPKSQRKMTNAYSVGGLPTILKLEGGLVKLTRNKV